LTLGWKKHLKELTLITSAAMVFSSAYFTALNLNKKGFLFYFFEQKFYSGTQDTTQHPTT